MTSTLRPVVSRNAQQGSTPTVEDVVLYVIFVALLARLVAVLADAIMYALAADDPPPLMVATLCKTDIVLVSRVSMC